MLHQFASIRHAAAKVFAQFSESNKDCLVAFDSGSTKAGVEVRKVMQKLMKADWSSTQWLLIPSKQKDLELRAQGFAEFPGWP